MFLFTFFGIIILFAASYFFDNQKNKNNQYNLYYRNDLDEFCEKNNYKLNNFLKGHKIKYICLIKYKNGKKVLNPLYNFNNYSEKHRYLESELQKGEILQYQIIDKPMNFKFPDPLHSSD